MCLIQIENDAGNRRKGAVLANAQPAHAIRVDLFLGSAVGDGAGKVEENPVRVYGRLNRRLNRRTERHFHAQAAAVPRYRNSLHGRGPGCVLLRGGGRHQEHPYCEMFANGHHIFATLASAPLESRAAACLLTIPSTCMANWT